MLTIEKYIRRLMNVGHGRGLLIPVPNLLVSGEYMKKGEKMSDELRQKIREAKLLRVTPEFRKKMREIGLRQVRKTRCKWGHEYAPENTYTDKNGYKTCRMCMARPEVAIKAAKYHTDAKIQVLSHYSPNEILGCSHEGCGVSDLDMLTLDHLNNDGAEHRDTHKISGGSSTYSYIKKNDYPDGYQTLCWNHQWKKQLMHLRTHGKSRRK
jgi:hypothetical protein